MADLQVGDCCPTALDESYAGYKLWCQRLGYEPAPKGTWLRIDRFGTRAVLAKAGDGASGLQMR